MATAKLNVSGMHCGHCQEKVTKALRGVAGVYSAIVDWPTGESEVDFNDDALTTDRLLAAVQQAGYEAKLAG